MKVELKQELEDWGVDLNDALARFMGNEDLMEKFLVKFRTDPNMDLLNDALQAQDAKEAFKACHALKGVAGNLSLNGFLQEVRDLTEILRADSLNGAQPLYDTIRTKYDALLAIINRYEGDS